MNHRAPRSRRPVPAPSLGARSLPAPDARTRLARKGFAVAAAGVAACALALLGCSNTGTDGAGGGNSGGAGNGSGNGAGNGAGNGTGGTGAGNGGTFSNGAGGTGSTMSGGVGGGCATTTQQAQKIPLDMFIMLDQSGSMADPIDPNNPASAIKWDAVTNALDAFVQQPQAAGLGVGIQFFGLPNGFSDSCTAADYANPLTPDGTGAKGVEIAPLPGNAAALMSSIAQHGPSTATPTKAALEGAIAHATAWQIAHPTHVVVTVLATDGLPNECGSLAQVNMVAAAGLASPQKIKTFVIGVGDQLTNLNGIAMAGGTGMAYIVNSGQPQQQFLAALNAIQGTALACNYIIPPPPMGQTADFGKLNVEYTPGGGGMSTIIKHVDSAAMCPANGDAWYYDNNAAPTQVIFCPKTCDTLKMDTNGQVHIVLGCQTVLN